MSNFFKVKLAVQILAPNTFESMGYKSVECYLSINTISKGVIIGRLVFDGGDCDKISASIEGLEFLNGYTLSEDLLKRYDSKFEDYLMGNFECNEIEEIINDKLTVSQIEPSTGCELFNYHVYKYSGTTKEEQEKTYFIDSEDSFCVFDPAEETDEDIEPIIKIEDEIIALPHRALIYGHCRFQDIEGINFVLSSLVIERQYHLDEDLWYYSYSFFDPFPTWDIPKDLSKELKIELKRLNVQWTRGRNLNICVD